MDAAGTYWYLQHVSTGKKIILQIGENTLGRHSSCKFVLTDYLFLSRHHANVIVANDRRVTVEQMNALNGVFINNIKLIENRKQLNCGDTIGLGVYTDGRQIDIPANHAIFVLKQSSINAEEIIDISDSEDGGDAANPNEVQNPNHSAQRRQLDYDNLIEVAPHIIQPPEVQQHEEPEAEQAASTSHNRTIHLPKLPEVKKELVSQQSKEIEDIFGDPDDELLESVFQINPYVYKELNNNNNNVANAKIGDKICDGDVIDLHEELPINNELNDVNANDNDEYDELFAMSQAVLQEMKEEMVDVPENDLSENNENHNQSFLSPYKVESSNVVTRIDDDDEIIVIEDDDDELFSKVADWSSKLLSQNVMSQVYPAEDNGNESDLNRQDREDENEESNLFARRPSKLLRIESSDDDDDTSLSNLASCLQAKKTTTLKPCMQNCRVRLKSIDVAKYLNEDDKEAADALTSNSADVPLNNGLVLEVELVPQSPKTNSKLKEKTSKITKRRAEISSRFDLGPEKHSQRTPIKSQETKRTSPSIVPVAELSEEPPNKKRCSIRLRSRSKSCYIERPVDEEESVAPKPFTTNVAEVRRQSGDAAKLSPMRQRSKSLSERSELCDNIAEPPKTAKLKGKSMEHAQKTQATTQEIMRTTQTFVPVAEPAKKLCSSRLRNRSKSCYIERPAEIGDVYTKSSTTDVPNATRSALCNDIKKILELRRFSVSTRSELCELANKPSQTADTNISKELKSKSIEVAQKAQTTPEEIKQSSQNIESKESLPKAETNQKSPRMLNRSKSFVLDRYNQNEEMRRGPKLVTAPHLPLHRGKLRGVSAEQKKKETAKIDTVLNRQRSRDYDAEMKKKWYQKPKDKKREYEQNKELRREQLQKLAEKSKASTSNSTSISSNSNDQKRKQLHVPTVGNCNRGEFLTKQMQPTIPKKTKLDKPKENEMGKEREKSMEKKKERENKPSTSVGKSLPKRRATIECFSQETVKSPPFHYSRPPERKEAEKARMRRTCNRFTFADMERDFQHQENINKIFKRNRHVRFNDNIQVRYIERVEGADKKVRNVKDTTKFSLSRYAERREWALAKGKFENYTDLITGNILSWANQWLSLRSPNSVAERDVLLPIPTEFKSYKQYKETLIPLMKVELLTTIEREYVSSKSSTSTFEVSLNSFSRDDKRHRPRFRLVTRYNDKPGRKFDLYTLCSGYIMKETFATLPSMQRIAGKIFELTFEILQKDISWEILASVKTKKITARPVVDNVRVELGAFNAVYQLGRSPLYQRILRPSENVLSFDRKGLKGTQYKGFRKLNEHQTDICLSTWIRLTDDSTPSITLIQGPPGTGKSMVITNLTLQCLYGSTNHILDRKILICAHSNAAVDNITLSLNTARKCMGHSKFRLLRFGWFEKMDPKVREVTLDHLLGQAQAEKRKRLTKENVDSLLQQQLELNMEIAELKQRSATVSYLQQQLQSKEQQLRLINDRLNSPLTPREEYEQSKNHIQRANIVCTTLSSCVKLATFIDYFDVCIIDEATQCTEPWTLLPLQFGVRGLVLVGDTQQLPATVLSQTAIEHGLGNSMFDRIQRNLKQQLNKDKGNNFVHTKVFKLSMQYRMHPEICRWPNNYFYEGDLVNGDCTYNLISPIIPYCVINLSFTRDTNDTNSRSISNYEEAHFVSRLLIELDKYLPTARFRYGLITPYSNQCQVLGKLIPREMMITPHTVDAYQGQERDVVILSNARTRGVGFLTNYQRLNVAITRARRCLIICGNFDDLQAVDMWRHLLDDARKRKIYFDLKRNDMADLNRSLIPKILVKPNEIKENAPVDQPSKK